MRERISDIPIIVKKQRVEAIVSDVGVIAQHIPMHEIYRGVVGRVAYGVDGGIIAQGILFDGVPEEQYLVLQRVNGGKRWKWSTVLPEYKTRKVVWKL